MAPDDPTEGGAPTGADTAPPDDDATPAGGTPIDFDAVAREREAQSGAAGPLGPGLQPGPRLAPPEVPQAPAPQWIDVAAIVDAQSFALRPADAVGPLAESIARQGQQTPVDLRPAEGGYQLLAGHRRLAAVRLLHRSRILARVHAGAGDEDAWVLALAEDLDRRPYSAAERDEARATLTEQGALTPRLEALLDRADAQAHAEAPAEGPEANEEEEIELESLAARVRDRLADDCNDVGVLYEMWADLDEGRRADLLECVGYLKDMYPLLASTEDEDPAE